MRKSNVLGEELGRTCKLKIHLFRFTESRIHKWEKVMCEVQQELLHVLHSCTLAQTIGAVIVGQQRHSVAAAQLTCIVYGKSSMSDRDPKMGLILHRLKPAFMHNPCHFSSSRTSPVVSSIMQMSIKPWASNVCLLDAKPATVYIYDHHLSLWFSGRNCFLCPVKDSNAIITPPIMEHKL